MANTENSTESGKVKRQRNLRPPFPKGTSGNPKGREPGETMTMKLRRILAEKDRDGVSNGDKIMAVAVKAAKRGDFRFFKEILERAEGKTPEQPKPDGATVSQTIVNVVLENRIAGGSSKAD